MLIKFADDTKQREVSPTRNKHLAANIVLSGLNTVTKQRRINLLGYN